MCIPNFGTIFVLDSDEKRLENIVNLLINDGWDVKGFKNYGLGCQYLSKDGDAISLIIIDADIDKKEYLKTISIVVNKQIHIPIMVISSNLEGVIPNDCSDIFGIIRPAELNTLISKIQDVHFSYFFLRNAIKKTITELDFLQKVKA